jgi:hypothetical protein
MKQSFKILLLIAFIGLTIYTFLKIRSLTLEKDKLNLKLEILTKQVKIERLMADSISLTSVYLKKQLEECQRKGLVKK